MDRNTIVGLLLMLLLAIGFSWYNASTMDDIEAQVATETPAATAQEVPAPPVVETPAAEPVVLDSATRAQADAALVQRFGEFAPAVNGEEKEIIVETKTMKLVFSNRGGMLRSATLTDGYTRYSDGAPVSLWDPAASAMQLRWTAPGRGELFSGQFVFEPSATYVDARNGAASLVMRLNGSDPSRNLELVYQFQPEGYAVNCQVRINGTGDQMDLAQGVKLHWQLMGLPNEKGLQAERSHTSIYYRQVEDDRDYLSESAGDQLTVEGKTHWMAFKQDFFSAAVIAPAGFRENANLAVVIPADSTHTKLMDAQLTLPLAAAPSTSADLTFFFGPNDYKVLRALEVDQFDRIIDYGWGIIGWVNKWAIRPLFWGLSSFIGSFGLIILIVTIIIKMALFPVTWKNFLSSAKMRVLKPEMEEINKKYEGKEAVEKQQAIMALYRQTGVNPFAGCIPVLIQMPILYAMFRFFPAEIVLRGKSFLWAEDLAAYDAIFSWDTHVPFLSEFYGNHVSGFTLLMCISTFIYTRMSMQSQPTMQQPGMPNMKVMMNLFTFMMLFFFNNMPSGLSFYYFAANMMSIGQMWVIKTYIIDEGAIRAKIDENKKKPVKKSSFQQRLEEMQKSQQKKLSEQKGKLGKK